MQVLLQFESEDERDTLEYVARYVAVGLHRDVWATFVNDKKAKFEVGCDRRGTLIQRDKK